MMLARPRVRFGAIAKSALVLLPVLLVLTAPQAALARIHRQHGLRRSHYAPISLTDPAKDAALVIDGETGRVLFARNAEAERHPASLTKIMTLYMLFDALKKGTITMQTPIPVSAHAAAQARIKLDLRAGIDTITPDQAIRAIIVRSANDVAVAVAEKLGGSESQFCEMMTEQAHRLGMTHTRYVDASGLPNNAQITTASDLAILARRISFDFPQYFHYFATPNFTWHGRTYPTIDHLIGHYDGADGMKTGFTDGSGFNIVTSVTRGDVHLIAVVMGGRSSHLRDHEVIHLLDDAFARIRANPALVAHNELPWKTPGAAPATMLAGFPLPSMIPQARPEVAAAAVTPELRPSGAVDPNDEEAAEARPDPADATDNEPADVIVPQPRPKPMLAAYQPPKSAAAAAVMGSPPADSAGLSSAIASLGLHDWTVQIGAYTDAKTAREQLAAYAEKSMDILGQAERIVAPFKGVDGHTMFRARFGPFAEREARRVCERLTERGQTCFAATAMR